MMDFFARFRDHYKSHEDPYHGATDLAETVTLSFGECVSSENPAVCPDSRKASHNLVRLQDGRTVLHVINHTYDAGVVELTGFRASFRTDERPSRVTLASLDFEADREAEFTYEGGMLEVDVGTLPASVAIVVE
ncbi:hypothetical protein [Sorangium sp. So ce131]|uniref:hypothetical protein n=1 Tax=Sorangium sp. So ce131 TaxID=3133282 RepID=UPI003F628688